MKVITVHRAQGVVDDVTLRIMDEIPNPTAIASPDFERESYARFDHEAEQIMEALKSLPGGTLDALLVRLLDRKRSHFVVTAP